MVIPDVEIDDVIARKTLENDSFEITKKYKNKVNKTINKNKCKSSWLCLNENCFVIMSWNKKKLNIGNSKLIDKIKTCKSVTIILDKWSFGIKPPDDIAVKARLNESKSLISEILKRKIINKVEKK